jgi:hypothetical protein
MNHRRGPRSVVEQAHRLPKSAAGGALPYEPSPRLGDLCGKTTAVKTTRRIESARTFPNPKLIYYWAGNENDIVSFAAR